VEHGQEGTKGSCVCVGGGRQHACYTWLLLHPGQIIRNVLVMAKESLEDGWNPSGDSCLKNEKTVAER